jgi:hypothetical protein
MRANIENWAFQVEHSKRVLARQVPLTRYGADCHAQRLANQHGTAVEYIAESAIAGWTNAHHQTVPGGVIVNPDDTYPAGLEEPGE